IVWTLHADFYVYAHSSDPWLAPATVLNPLLDALEAALAPSPSTGIQNLGLPAVVQHAYITGKVEADEGGLCNPGVASGPVDLLGLEPRSCNAGRLGIRAEGWRPAPCAASSVTLRNTLLGSQSCPTKSGPDRRSRRLLLINPSPSPVLSR